MTRRGFLCRGSALAGGLVLPSLGMLGCVPGPPFTLGVASGDPSSYSVVLWTRLAPTPLVDGGGMPAMAVPVDWEVALDPGMTQVVRQGTAVAHPALAHSVHVDVLGLPSDSWLWYRFTSGGFASPVGRTRTFPEPSASPARMRFVLASCQNYVDGFYGAYGRMVEEDDVDCVVHVGDYLYTLSGGGIPGRELNRPVPTTLQQYRDLYAAYKLDPQLQAAHAAYPFIHSWDDHEVTNDYGGDFEGGATSTPAFLARRTAAYQANYEHLPLSSATATGGFGERMYRRLRFGDLAQILSLDSRRNRSSQPCTVVPSPFAPVCAAAADPARTILGAPQEAWLQRRFEGSSSLWNLIGQGTMVAELVLDIPGLGSSVQRDSWPGHPAARTRLLEGIESSGVANPVVLTGDFHSTWVADLKVDSFDTSAPAVATEFVGPAISSEPALGLAPFLSAVLAGHPHFVSAEVTRNGYVLFDLDRERCRAEYRVLDDVTDPDSAVSTLASFEVEDGAPGATEVV